MRTRGPVKFGLALGSGAARGWAHVGVIRALEAAGIRPEVVCGASVGALVGAAYAAGELDRLERWVLSLGWREVLSLMDPGLNGALLKGARLTEFFRRHFEDRPLEALPRTFAAVATSLHDGAEVWLREGSTLEAVRASMALPALFPPAAFRDRLLVDGGLVNPVPVSLARAMGADVVIAVDLNGDILGRHLERPAPSMLDVLASSINIMQVRITRSRMAGDPPDLVVAPRLAHLGLLDFHRAREAIDEGMRAVERIAGNLEDLRGQDEPAAS